MPAPVQIGRVSLTKQQLRATEIMLYRMADLVDRLLADNKVPYTKVSVDAPYPAPQGVAGQMQPTPTPLASDIAPPGGY